MKLSDTVLLCIGLALAITAMLLANTHLHEHAPMRRVAVCTEDMWCWQPLLNGNHRGYVDVFPQGQPFRVIASYPQPTTGG